MAATIQALVPRMRDICGAGNVITDPLDLRTYECDGLTSHRCVPALVVLPGSAAEVAEVVALCAQARVPFVARGSGTGLSGGALPHESGVLIVMSRMRAIVEIDPVSRRAVVEPGVTNLAVSKAAAPFGLFYAPDPSSQVVCSVGGNVAENSGGAHCLKNGFTVHHVTGLEIVTPSGELTWLGDGTGVFSAGSLNALGWLDGRKETVQACDCTVRKEVKPLAEQSLGTHAIALQDGTDAAGRPFLREAHPDGELAPRGLRVHVRLRVLARRRERANGERRGSEFYPQIFFQGSARAPKIMRRAKNRRGAGKTSSAVSAAWRLNSLQLPRHASASAPAIASVTCAALQCYMRGPARLLIMTKLSWGSGPSITQLSCWAMRAS